MAYSFTYGVDPYYLPTGSLVNITKTITSGSDTGAIYKINRSLPSGITLNSTNGSMTGNTLFSSISIPLTYIVDASFSTTNSYSSIILGVSFLPVFNYAGGPFIREINKPIYPELIPTYLISNLVGIVYSDVSSDISLNNIGLNLNVEDGHITGTPTAIFNPTLFTIRANNTGVIYNASFNLSVQQLPAITYGQEIYRLIQGENVNILSNFVESQTNVTYTIEGCKLPYGIVFNTTTGAITGTPTILTTLREYKITVTNSIGSSSTNLILNIIKDLTTTPVRGDNFPSNTFLTNPAIEMRRKAEILKYKQNSSGLTKNQYTALLAKGNAPLAKRAWGNQSDNSTNPNISGLSQDGNTLICNSDSIISVPTSSSNVPGPIMNLYYNPNTPLVGYIQPNKQRTNIGMKWPFSK